MEDLGVLSSNTIVSSCQDCHMPKATAAASRRSGVRKELKSHELAGGGAHSLDLVAALTANNQDINQSAIARGKSQAVSMFKEQQASR